MTSLLPSTLCPPASTDAQAIAQFELGEYINTQAIAVPYPQEDLLDRAFDELTHSEWEQLSEQIDACSDRAYELWANLLLLPTVISNIWKMISWQVAIIVS